MHLFLGAVSYLSVAATTPHSPAYDQWYGRSIYFVVTDRFSKSGTDAGTHPCVGKDWCGGTLKGVLERLDYIQDLGFDAVWITPVVKQVPWLDRWNGTGYHGYWAQDFNAIDPHIGTEADLLALSAALHRQ